MDKSDRLRETGADEIAEILMNSCAQIVPVKVKYFQTVPNETKSKLKN
jgi:hypothetical protein